MYHYKTEQYVHECDAMYECETLMWPPLQNRPRLDSTNGHPASVEPSPLTLRPSQDCFSSYVLLYHFSSMVSVISFVTISLTPCLSSSRCHNLLPLRSCLADTPNMMYAALFFTPYWINVTVPVLSFPNPTLLWPFSIPNTWPAVVFERSDPFPFTHQRGYKAFPGHGGAGP